MKVPGYNYELLVLRTCESWPRMRCWVCEVLLPALAEEHGESRRPALAEVARCRDISGDRWPDAHHLLSKQRLKQERPDGLIQWPGEGWIAFFDRAAPTAMGPRGGGHPILELGDLLMDVRNCIPVRRYHHDALERGLLNGVPFGIPRALLPERTRRFAEEFGLLGVLERDYPEEIR